MGKKRETGLYQREDTCCISYFHNGKHIRKAIGTKGEARKELTAIRARIDGPHHVPPREDPYDGLVDDYDAIQKKKAGYVTEQYYIARVREYFKGQIVQAAPERVKRPAKGNGRTQYIKLAEDVRRLLDACPPHLYAIVLCCVDWIP